MALEGRPRPTAARPSDCEFVWATPRRGDPSHRFESNLHATTKGFRLMLFSSSPNPSS
jgi:hypothetical protein